MRSTLSKLVLIVGSLLVALRVFYPPLYFKTGRGTFLKYKESLAENFYPIPDYQTALFHALGITIVTVVVYFIVRTLNMRQAVPRVPKKINNKWRKTFNTLRPITREALIIIFLVLFFGLFQALDYWQSHRVSPHQAPIIGKSVPFKDLPDEIKRKGKDIFDISSLPDMELFDAAGIPIMERPLFYRIDFSLLSFLFLMSYPLYWLVRFTIRIINTMREKE